jgi:hypothetical protein
MIEYNQWSVEGFSLDFEETGFYFHESILDPLLSSLLHESNILTKTTKMMMKTTMMIRKKKKKNVASLTKC